MKTDKMDRMDLSRFENLTTEREKLSALSHRLNELEEQKRKIEGQATQLRKFNLADGYWTAAIRAEILTRRSSRSTT